MKRDEAIRQARDQLDVTGIPQTIRMAPDGEWDCRPITALRHRRVDRCGLCGDPVTDGDVCIECAINERRDAEPVS